MYQAAESSGELTADGAIFAAPCQLAGVNILTDGSNNATVILYDNASAASGTKVYEGEVVAANLYGGRNFIFPIRCHNGLYLDITGTGASVIVDYIPKAG